jgi:hypothetical protein
MNERDRAARHAVAQHDRSGHKLKFIIGADRVAGLFSFHIPDRSFFA